jgi:hypothetical protein
MSMFGNALVKQLEKEKDGLILEMKKLENELIFQKRQSDLKTAEAINKLREEMNKRLVESDILRNEAKAKLEIYEKMDTKTDAECIKNMVKQLIETIGKMKNDVNIIK